MLPLAYTSYWWSLQPNSIFARVEKEFLAIIQVCDIKWDDVYEMQCVNCKGPSNLGQCFNTSIWGHWKLMSPWVVSGRLGVYMLIPLSPVSEYVNSGWYCLPCVKWDTLGNCRGCGCHPALSLHLPQALRVVGLVKFSSRNCPWGRKAFEVHFCTYESFF